MASFAGNIVSNKQHMESITLKFNTCADYVGDIISETEIMKQIFDDCYSGSAADGLEDYFSVLKQHLELLQQCYTQLGSYTKVAKDLFIQTDLLLGFELLKGGKIK